MSNKIASAVIILLITATVWAVFSYRARLRSIDASMEETENLLKQREREAAGKSYLTTCSVCDGKVSSTAEKCPHCGEAR